MMEADTVAEVRAVIENWARAVAAKDLEGVVAAHTQDVVMFDVPPPVAVKGLADYRNTWPPFFEYLIKGDGVFEIVTLDVTAGETVAFATAVLRCGSREELSKNAEPQLRLSIGLRKEDGGWKIAHEHHSFPLPPTGT
jgi:uncharacterized protein (TIGR02246 family)